MLNYSKKVEENGTILFEAYSLKMYESYPEVKAFYNWMDSLNEEDFRYIELGEEDGDISTKGLNYELIDVHTTVEVW